MSTYTEHDDRPGPGDDTLGRLIRLAGRRREPPRAAHEQVYAAAAATWQSTVQRRRRRRLSYAMAASLAIAAVLIGMLQTVWRGPGEAGLEIASADIIAGSVQAKGRTDTAWRMLTGGPVALGPGTRLRIAEGGGLGLTLAGGDSLRLDEDTEIWFESPARVHLDRGAVYLDTGSNGSGAAAMEIVTPLGSVTHVGTQFEVRYSISQMRLRVREGAVLLRQGDEAIRAEAGQQLRVDLSGARESDRITTYDGEWAWVQALAPLPDAEDQSLSRLLEWVSRETGRPIHFATPELRARAYTTVLHGSPQRLVPMEALAVMLQTTDFQYTVTGDSEILIEDRRPR